MSNETLFIHDWVTATVLYKSGARIVGIHLGVEGDLSIRDGVGLRFRVSDEDRSRGTFIEAREMLFNELAARLGDKPGMSMVGGALLFWDPAAVPGDEVPGNFKRILV